MQLSLKIKKLVDQAKALWSKFVKAFRYATKFLATNIWAQFALWCIGIFLVLTVEGLSTFSDSLKGLQDEIISNEQNLLSRPYTSIPLSVDDIFLTSKSWDSLRSFEVNMIRKCDIKMGLEEYYIKMDVLKTTFQLYVNSQVAERKDWVDGPIKESRENLLAITEQTIALVHKCRRQVPSMFFREFLSNLKIFVGR